MADNCSRLMKEGIDLAIQEFRGIEFTYKLDDVLDTMNPSQKFSAKQLEGYLTKQGVSPKEIKQSGIFEGMADDNRALPIGDWRSMSGNQRVNVEDPKLDHYGDITLGRRGEGNPTYKEQVTTIKAPKTNVPSEPHFNVNDSTDGEQSLLGWRRTHVQEIEGKPTLVLNEFQSDWAQTERAGRGTFESTFESKFGPSNPSMTKEKANEIFAKYIKSFFGTIQKTEVDKGLSRREFEDKYWADWVHYRTVSGPAELREANKLMMTDHTNIVADFPMSEIKHHQFQIVGAIDDALKQGIDTIVIPIERENELAGSAGVTKFYESLNKKVLPDIRKKLEKQGMRIKVDKTHYKGGRIDYSESFNRFINDALTPEERKDLGYLQDLATNHLETYGVENEALYAAIDSANTIDDLLKALQPTSTNELWILTVEEIPNKRVKWDVYGLLGALGLSEYANKKEEL